MMAGRGRGRGFRTNFSLDAEPTPLYPVLDHKPLPLSGGEQVEYLLALKQEFRGASRNLPSFIQTRVQRPDVDRYSDKYHNQDQDQDWTPDWTRFPKELRVRSQKLRPPGVSSKVKPAPKPKTQQKDLLQKLETLEQKEKHSDEEEEEEEKKGEEEEGEEEQVEEDEFEEETDYIMSYFDNGEEFGGDSDDDMDEAIY